MVIKEKSNGKWVITLSFFLAYLLAIVPFPEWAMDYRPEWVSMVLVYWVMALPYRVGIGSAWFIGLILDILKGSVLGINAMALVIVAYVTLSLHLRFRMFSSLQQAGLVLVLGCGIAFPALSFFTGLSPYLSDQRLATSGSLA